ncbi:cytochrome oxidase assembly protein [Bremerella cremea]|uniref:Cytochrome oxidase assembly protein n=1 Tax=Blastopirellula marina TaxID=124 RepID=A0A2S8FQR0_9BACT|nr:MULTISPECIES: COX15/CtaA family protein [Pirellulaceae]PQO34502.1 cytochrome oxidase assembly protein [Blastopirellula marina]RCS46998.1 cytochrome oxidase assembly protein [Bremerella cremea]
MTELSQSESRWPHRLALLLVLTTYPLIWIGGLVTTTKSGMAVPDWPSTYGYNMFLYPWQTWVFGPYDLFLEHGHRLLASTVGFLCILFLGLAIWRKDRTQIWLASAALVLVLAQGILGGLRVVLDATTIARVHGCVGPLFFGYLVYLECRTSRRWQLMSPIESEFGRTYVLRSVSFVVLAFLQIALGSLIRHVPATMPHQSFRVAVLFHVITAFLVAANAMILLWLAVRDRQSNRHIVVVAVIAVLLVVGQIGLGIAAYTVKYNWPTFLPRSSYFAGFVIEWESNLQAMIVTGHVAVGSAILAVAVMLATYSSRCYSNSMKISKNSAPQTSHASAKEVMV